MHLYVSEFSLEPNYAIGTHNMHCASLNQASGQPSTKFTLLTNHTTPWNFSTKSELVPHYDTILALIIKNLLTEIIQTFISKFNCDKESIALVCSQVIYCIRVWRSSLMKDILLLECQEEVLNIFSLGNMAIYSYWHKL